MDDLSKYYQVLGLEAGASLDEVKQAYRDLVKVWHPDRFAHDERLRLMAQDKLKEINGAYELLQARVFEAAIAPEPTAGIEPEAAAVTPSARGRVALWTTLSILALALMAATAVWVLGRGKGANAANPLLPGRTHHALSFDRNHGHVAVATTGSLTGTFTVECWALNRRPKQGGTIVSSRAPNDFTFNIKFRQGKRFHADIGDGSRWLAKMANATFPYQRDTWYHIAYVVTPTNYNIYINGTPADDGQIYPPGNPMLYDVNHRLCFGVDGLDPDDLDGNLAEIRIWKTARNSEQIKANMNKLLAGNEPGLQGYWRFAEGSGTVTADSSGHGFVGRLVADVSWSTNGPAIVRQ